MADLDAELLALAGGDSSGEESLPSPPARKSPSPIRAQKVIDRHGSRIEGCRYKSQEVKETQRLLRR